MPARASGDARNVGAQRRFLTRQGRTLVIPSTPTETPAGQRIVTLKRMQAAWTTELPYLVDVAPERAFHYAEALDDLAALIRQLEHDSERPQ
jgi:hypothetical protein